MQSKSGATSAKTTTRTAVMAVKKVRWNTVLSTAGGAVTSARKACTLMTRDPRSRASQSTTTVSNWTLRTGGV